MAQPLVALRLLEGRTLLLGTFLSPSYHNTIQTSCPWVLRCLAAAVAFRVQAKPPHNHSQRRRFGIKSCWFSALAIQNIGRLLLLTYVAHAWLMQTFSESRVNWPKSVSIITVRPYLHNRWCSLDRSPLTRMKSRNHATGNDKCRVENPSI